MSTTHIPGARPERARARAERRQRRSLPCHRKPIGAAHHHEPGAPARRADREQHLLTILNTNFLRKAGVSEERITAVSSCQDAPYFTDAERAALALVEATLQPAPVGKEGVSDELYADKALATLTIVVGQISFLIALAVIGKPQPVASLAPEQWG